MEKKTLIVDQINSDNAQVLHAVDLEADKQIAVILYRLAVNAQKKEIIQEAQELKDILSL